MRNLVRLKGFERLINVDKSLSTFLSRLRLKRLGIVQVPLKAALGKVLAEDVIAERDLPPFNRSAVDGYALRSQDTSGASQLSPKVLKLSKMERIGERKARQIWTGNPIPQGADAVVMLEHTKRVKGDIKVWNPVIQGKNVSRRGEDVGKGDLAINKGTRLRSHHIGLLASLGKTHVSVVRKPRVAIFSTGNELGELGRKLEAAQVVDANRPILSCLCTELGAAPLDLGIVKDRLNEIKARIQEGVNKANLVLTTGGTSVGYTDLVPTAINEIGAPGVIVHGIAMRPSMPTALAILKGKPIIALPGNPVAAMIGFEVFARPIILRLLGVDSEPRPVLRAKLTRRIPSALGRRVYLRVHVFERDRVFFAEPIRVKGAGLLTTMTKANGYVIIPEDREGLMEGESLIVHIFDKVVRE